MSTTAVITASTAADGTQSGSAGDVPTNGRVLSNDGRYVVFTSGGNLTGTDANGAPDIFRRDLTTGEVIKVSETADGVQGNGIPGLRRNPGFEGLSPSRVQGRALEEFVGLCPTPAEGLALRNPMTPDSFRDAVYHPVATPPEAPPLTPPARTPD